MTIFTASTAAAEPLRVRPRGSVQRPRTGSGARLFSAAVTALTAVLLAGCTPDPSSPADNRNRDVPQDGRGGSSTTAAIPYEAGTEKEARAFRALRKLDACALLDLDAAAQAVGGNADSLLPDASFARCTLDVSPDEPSLAIDSWTISAEVGVRFDEFDIKDMGATPQPVPGAPADAFFREQGTPESPSCSIVRPLAAPTGYGIQLEVRGPLGVNEAQAAACDAAVRYLERMSRRWLDPPTRADDLTQPQMPLADRDPCEATTAIGTALGRSTRARPADLYTCTISAAATGSTGQQELQVSYTVAADPASREPSDTPDSPRPVTIAGHAGTQTRDRDGCTTAIATADEPAIDTDDGARVQILIVTASPTDLAASPTTGSSGGTGCDDAHRATEAALNLLTSR